MRTNTHSRLKSFFAVLLGLAFALPIVLASPTPDAEAAINEQVNFQGRLTDSSGNIVADGDYNIEFKLHNHATNTGGGQGTCSGSCVWMETRTSANVVTVSRGLFSVQLGEVTSVGSVDFNQDLYLSVRLGGTGTPSWDTEMTPRHRLGAAPTAITAAQLMGYVPGNSSGQLPISNGTLNTNLNADLLDGQSGSYYLDLTNATGTLDDARLSSNVALLDVANTFTQSQTISNAGGKTTLQLSNTGADTGLTIGGDTNLYRGAADTLVTDDGVVVSDFLYADTGLYAGAPIEAEDDEAQQTRIGGVGPTGKAALSLGLADDTQLYRDAADNLKTDDTFDAAAYEVGGTAGSSATCSGGQVLEDPVVSGGIVTGGTCAAGGGGSSAWQEDGTFTNLLEPISGSHTGILLGGDTNLYRDAADLLKSDDTLEVSTGVLSPDFDTPSGTAASISRTGRASGSSIEGIGTSSFTPSGTFTPNADKLLVAYVYWESHNQDMATDGSDVTITGGGLTWAPITGRFNRTNGWGIGHRAFYAYTTSSPPSNMQVTVDAGSEDVERYHVAVDEMSGVHPSSPVAGAVSASRQSNDHNTWTATLGATPETADWKVLVGSIEEDSGSHVWDTPGGWTEIHSLGLTPDTTTMYQTSSTSTTLNYDLNNIDYSNVDTTYGGFILKSAGSTATLDIGTTNATEINIGNSAAATELDANSEGVKVKGENSTTAFRVEPSDSGTPVLDVDTTNDRVGIGLDNPTTALSLASGTTAAEGVAFGTDTNLYRGAADRLDVGVGDSFRVANAGGEYLTAQNDVTGVYLNSLGSAAGDWVFSGKVAGDSNPRGLWHADGTFEWGPGNAAVDTNLYREAAGVLSTDNALNVYDGIYVQGGGNGSIVSAQGVTADPFALSYVGAEGEPRLKVESGGQISWGGGSAAPDTTLYRSDVGELSTNGAFLADGRIYSDDKITASNDDAEQIEIGLTDSVSGKPAVVFGYPEEDTNLYRDSANNLKTDDTFDAAAYEVGGTAGLTGSCSAGEAATGLVVEGGIVTSADGCATPGGGSSLWSQNGSEIYYDSGNVGVGVTNPNAEFHVGGPGTNDSGGTIALGDYDESTFHGVVISEEGTGDSDVLQLQGEDGLKVTTGDTSQLTTLIIDGEAGNGTVNFYPVIDVTDAFTVNNAEDTQPIFRVDTLNERLGLNVSTPETELQIYGQGTNGSEARISFGDYDEVDWHGVAVGEWGTGDTDELQLQGAGGVKLTTGDTGEYTVLDIDAGTGQMDIRPVTDGTASVAVLNAADTETPFSIDTANSRLGVNDPTPDSRIELERNTEAAEENGIQLSTNDGEDWKVYQPTGSSNLAFFTEGTGTNVGTFTTAGQLQLSVQGSGGGLTLGGDVNLYRGAADRLQTDDDLHVGDDITIYDTLFFGSSSDASIFRVDPDFLVTPGSFASGGTIYADDKIAVEREADGGPRVALDADAGGSGLGGLLFGTGGGGADTALYRSTTNTLSLGSNDLLDIPGGSISTSVTGGTAAFFNRSNNGTIVSLRRAGGEQGTISVNNSTVSYNAFTGSHYADAQEPLKEGALVTQTGKNGYLHDDPNSEILYGVKRTTRANDSQVMGAYLDILNPKKPKSDQDQPESKSNPSLIMAVGNGEVWVADTGKDLKPGDNLISSDVAGHAMRDPGTHPVSHVIAKVAEPLQWDDVEETVDRDGKKVKHAKVSVFFTAFDKPNDRATKDELEKVDKKADENRKTVDELRKQADKTNERIKDLEENKSTESPAPPVDTGSDNPDTADDVQDLRADAIAADQERDAKNDERFENVEGELSRIAALVRGIEVGGNPCQSDDSSTCSESDPLKDSVIEQLGRINPETEQLKRQVEQLRTDLDERDRGILAVVGDLTVNGNLTLNDDIRGIDIAIQKGKKQIRINFERPQKDDRYAIQVEPSWLTLTAVTGKDADGFTVEFDKITPDEAAIDWLLVR